MNYRIEYSSLGFGLLVFMLLPISIMPAQTLEVSWYTIDGGGGVSSSGPFEIAGTIGQLDTGPEMTGGSFSVEGGFWADVESIILGDLNGDGMVTLADVTPFVNAVTTGDFIPEADINGDGQVDLQDVGPFVELLTGG